MHFRTLKSQGMFRILRQNYYKSKFVESINEEGGIQNYFKNRNINFDPDQFLDSFNKMKIELNKEMFLTLMIESVVRMIPSVCVRNWLLLVPQNKAKFFITSDHPVVFFNSKFSTNDYMPGFNDKNTDIIFPIFPKLCLYASFKVKSGMMRISNSELFNINDKIAAFCHKYYFSNTNNYESLFRR